jgi:predicted acyltransferase
VNGWEKMSSPAVPPRIEALDEFRGFLLLLMIAANFLLSYKFVPDWLKHSTVFGKITLTDLGAPLFIFAVGISLGLVFRGINTATDLQVARNRYIRRGLVLIAFGVIGSVITHRPILRDWEIFQTIGLAGIIALPFITLTPARRIGAAVLLMLTFQAISRADYGVWLRQLDVGGLGGTLGGIAWAGIILIGSTVSQRLRDNGRPLRRQLLAIGLIAATLTVIIRPFQPFDKRLVTGSYLALTTSLAALTLWGFVEVTNRLRHRFWPFTVLGANSLVTFITHGIVILALQAAFPPTSPSSLALIALAALYAACFVVAGYLYHRRLFIRL